MFVRKSKLALVFIKNLGALCVSTKMKRLELFTRDTAILNSGRTNQLLYLFQSHADLKSEEFASWYRGAHHLAFDLSISRLHNMNNRLGCW